MDRRKKHSKQSKVQETNLLQLPDELILAVLSHMDGACLFNMALTSMRMYKMVTNEEELWTKAFARTLPMACKSLLVPPLRWNFCAADSRLFLALVVREKHNLIEKLAQDGMPTFVLTKTSRKKLKKSWSKTQKSLREETVESDTRPIDSPYTIADDQVEVQEAQLVCNTLIRHLHDLRIVEAGTFVVRRMCYFVRGEAKDDQIYANFNELNTVDLLLSFLINYKDNTTLISNVLIALGNLATYPANGNELVEKGLKVLMKTLKRHSNDSQVVDNGLFVLKNIAETDLLHRKTIRECGTMEVVDKHLIRFIEGDPDENKVQAQAAFATLRVLASDLSAVDIGTKYVEMCMKVVLRFYDAPEMQDIIFAALQVLLVITEWNETNREAAFAYYDELFGLTKHSMSPTFLPNALLVLFKQLWTKPGMHKEKREVITLAIRAIKTHKGNLTLLRAATAVIADFARQDITLKNYIAGTAIIHIIKTELTVDVDTTQGFWRDVLVDLV